MLNIQPAAEGVDALLLAADCYSEISDKNKIPAISEQLLHSLKAAFDQEQKIQAITQKILSLWRERADVRAWLEDQALNHQKDRVRTAIAQGMAAIELPHLDNVPKLVNNLGDFFFQQNRFEEAIQAYLCLNSTLLISRFHLIGAYAQLKEYDEAIRLCQRIIEQEISYGPLAYQELISVYRMAGSYGEAIHVYERVAESYKGETQKKVFC